MNTGGCRRPLRPEARRGDQQYRAGFAVAPYTIAAISSGVLRRQSPAGKPGPARGRRRAATASGYLKSGVPSLRRTGTRPPARDAVPPTAPSTPGEPSSAAAQLQRRPSPARSPFYAMIETLFPSRGITAGCPRCGVLLPVRRFVPWLHDGGLVSARGSRRRRGAKPRRRRLCSGLPRA